MTDGERARFEARAKLDLYHRRLERARSRVAEVLAIARRPYVSFSGGKDSEVVLHLAAQEKPGITAFFFDSGAEYPDTYALMDHVARSWPVRLLVRKPRRGILDIYRALGVGHSPATETYRAGMMKRELIEEPAAAAATETEADAYLLGLRAEESAGRAANLRRSGHLLRLASGLLRSCPIWDWSAADVWAYLVTSGEPWNGAYDRTALRPREEIRVASWAGGTGARYGRFAWLRREYPDIYRRFAAEFAPVGRDS